jgi:hypothetical protein
MEVQQISHSEHVSVHRILWYTFFIMDHCSIELAEGNYPVCVCLCACVCVFVCVSTIMVWLSLKEL